MDARTLRAKEKYEGKTFGTKEGKGTFTVLQFNSGSDIVIKFGNSDLIRHVSSYDFTKGINYPFANSCVYFEDPVKELMGTYFWTNQGYIVKVIGVKTKKEVTVQFQDKWGYIFTTTIQNIKNGEVKNPYHPNKFGGYLGVGPYSSDEYNWVYRIWHNMIIRSKDHEYYAKYRVNNPTNAYDDTDMCNQWLCYNTFATWYINEISKLNPNYSYEIDKDLKYRFYYSRTGGKKYYSPDTVCLMPHDLNTSLHVFSDLNNFSIKNVLYELERNEELIQKAEFYHNENAISDITYHCIVDSFKPADRSSTC